MKFLAWAVLLGGVLSGCAYDPDTKPSFTLEPNVQPSRSRPVAIDPVCGITVDPSTPWKAVFSENVYYFHSEKCRGRFGAEPDYWAFGPYPDSRPRVERNMALFTDPVCGRETTETRWSMRHGDRVYYFHDNECYLEFRVHPQAYITPDLQPEAK